MSYPGTSDVCFLPVRSCPDMNSCNTAFTTGVVEGDDADASSVTMGKERVDVERLSHMTKKVFAVITSVEVHLTTRT